MLDLNTRLRRVSALAEPARRGLYDYVGAQSEPVTRDQAATALDMPVHVAKFNLDRLVKEGLLVADYRRPEGRGGPGGGRPTKHYRRAGVELEVSLPERRYELAARLLVQAVANSRVAGVDTTAELRRLARDAGREAGASLAASWSPGSPPSAFDALVAGGYEPRAEADGISLMNCPFHALLGDQTTELVCGMNELFVTGLIEGLGLDDYQARLDPQPAQCCVRLSADQTRGPQPQ